MTKKEIIRKLELVENAGKLMIERCCEARQELQRLYDEAPPKRGKNHAKKERTRLEIMADLRRRLIKNQ